MVNFKKKLLKSSGTALFTMFVWELMEELLENLIAYTVSGVIALFITKAISTIFIISVTQGIKTLIKRFLVPYIKQLTYKEGKDKMNKLVQFFKWIWANKKSLCGTIVGAVGTGIGITASWTIEALPDITLKGVNVAPIIYTIGCIVCFVLNEFGVCGKGFETVKTFLARLELIKQHKEEMAILKEAEKEIARDEKLANQTQADYEKAQAKAKAEQQAKAEKEKADAEHRARVEEAKAKLLANKSK